MIEVGATLGGYRVERLLGRGGMGVVYEAIQISLGRRVALKLLRPELADDEAFVDRIRREGRVQASLEHPHVLDVYGIEETPHGLVLAMRLVEGPTLLQLVREGALPARRALRLLGQVADALDAAHETGLLHRDVKPQNVLVGEGDTAFLADFGLSRSAADTATASRATVGTVAYVAPEVIHGELPTAASDRYAFAATLFHCLTGDVVFPRGSDAAVLYAHTSDPPPSISARRPALPQGLDRHFAAALAKDPSQRPARAAALVAAARELLGDEDLPAPDAPPTLPDRPPATPAGRGRRRDRRPAVLAATAIVAAAVGAGAVALVVTSDSDTVEVPVAAVAAGAEALGSTLGAPDRTLDCRGDTRRGTLVACSIVQAEGPQLVAPSDGTIVGWSVRGARGDLALDVVRPGGEDTIRVGMSQWQTAGNVAPHRFATDLPVERGDVLGLQLGPGARIGVRDAEGATTQRWLRPLGGFYGRPNRGPGTGFDHEVLLRAEFVAGRRPAAPQQLTGAAAARAPDGVLRGRERVEISTPRSAVVVELREVGAQVVLDLVRGDRRAERLVLPGLRPGGDPAQLSAFTIDGEPYSDVTVRWVNPNSGRLLVRGLSVSRSDIQLIS